MYNVTSGYSIISDIEGLKKKEEPPFYPEGSSKEGWGRDFISMVFICRSERDHAPPG